MTLQVLLGGIIWLGIIGLQIVLMAIAHFFERTSQRRTGFQWYALPIVCTGVAAARYLTRILSHRPGVSMTGDPVANVLLLGAGLLLIVLGNSLHDKMMENASDDGF